MIFTPLVKNKLASSLALPQSDHSTGNHQGRWGGLGKFTFPRVVIDGGERRVSEEEREEERAGSSGRLWHTG